MSCEVLNAMSQGMFLVEKENYGRVHIYWELNPPWILNKYQAINQFSSTGKLPVPNMQSWKGAWPKTYLSSPNDVAPNSRKSSGCCFFSHSTATDGRILGSPGNSDFQMKTPMQWGSATRLVELLQLNGKRILNYHLAADWKLLYLFSEML